MANRQNQELQRKLKTVSLNSRLEAAITRGIAAQNPGPSRRTSSRRFGCSMKVETPRSAASQVFLDHRKLNVVLGDLLAKRLKPPRSTRRSGSLLETLAAMQEPQDFDNVKDRSDILYNLACYHPSSTRAARRTKPDSCR